MSNSNYYNYSIIARLDKFYMEQEAKQPRTFINKSSDRISKFYTEQDINRPRRFKSAWRKEY